jgi:predicted molibdopterin-dependent oxidoreductase YjgC
VRDHTRCILCYKCVERCGAGCVLDVHVQGGAIVQVTSPLASTVTEGYDCIKGRFGFGFVTDAARR